MDKCKVFDILFAIYLLYGIGLMILFSWLAYLFLSTGAMYGSAIPISIIMTDIICAFLGIIYLISERKRLDKSARTIIASLFIALLGLVVIWALICYVCFLVISFFMLAFG